MMEKVYITEMGLTDRFREFEEAILVKVIPYDFLDYYQNNQDEDDYDEVLIHEEKWLMFNRYPGKDEWLIQKKEKCERGFYWEIDLNKFILRSTSVTEKGEWFIRPIYQVIMASDNIDAVEASEVGIVYTGRTGAQIFLDELNLPLIGAEDSRYYLLTEIQPDNSAYAIPYNIVGPPGGGTMKFDEIVVQKSYAGKNGYIVVSKKPEVGVYYSLTKKLFKFLLNNDEK